MTNTTTRIRKVLLRDKYLIVLSLPAFVYFLVLCYIPMFGNILAFTDYKPGVNFFNMEWVGFRWFEEFFSSVYFLRNIRNTLLLSLYLLIFSFPASIIFALLLNEVRNKKFKSLTQTLSYMPYFVSTIVVIGILKNILSPTDGIINMMLTKAGIESIDFLASNEWFRSLYVISDIWQTCGWGSIVYLGAISSIDPQLYEASFMDGANRWHQLKYITLPSISQTIIMLLIIRVGSVMSISFEKVILMYTPLTYDVADVIQTYVYRRGLLDMQYGFATAVGLFNSVVNFVLIVAVNKICRKYSDTSIW